MNAVKARLAEVRGRIDEACRRAGRSPGEVKLLAVSKRQPDERLWAAYEAGQRAFGENYVQELVRKRDVLPMDASLHMIGAVQSKKKKQVLAADMIQTLDRAKLLHALAEAVQAAGAKRLPVLIQVNIGEEPQKAGVSPEAASDLLKLAMDTPQLSVEGLMAIPPPGEGRRHFAALRELRDQLSVRFGTPLSELSMGMSDDYEAAILEGATWVRVGSAIFGARQS